MMAMKVTTTNPTMGFKGGFLRVAALITMPAKTHTMKSGMMNMNAAVIGLLNERRVIGQMPKAWLTFYWQAATSQVAPNVRSTLAMPGLPPASRASR